MTMRERMLAVVRGEPVDRVPFIQYSGLAAPNRDVWELLGRDNLGLLTWIGSYWLETPHCRYEHEDFERDGVRGYRTTIHTSAGSLTQEKRIEPVFHSAATRHFYVREPDDYHALVAYLRDVVVHPNVDGVAKLVEELGEDGLPHLAVKRTPYQQLWVEWVSLEHLALHLVDVPALMAEVFAALRDVQSRILDTVIEVARQVPVPWIVFPDNITAPAIGERWFREHCLSAYHEMADKLDAAGLDLPIHVHMDGDLKPLWSAIDESPVTGIDSLSPPPDNDTRVADAIGRWPQMRVFPNFPSSVHLAPDAEVYRVAMQLLEEGGRSGRFWIQISENVPPFAWRTSFPAIVRATHDFGPSGG